MNPIPFQKRVLLYGARSNPLSYFLSRQLNILLSSRNVFVADTPQSMQSNRMPSDRKYSCNETVVEDKRRLINHVEEHEITNVIDMTNGTLLEEKGDLNLNEELPRVNIVSPCFSLYQKAVVAPAVEKRQTVRPENLSDDKPLSEEEYDQIE